jgi:hypothetical protein
LTPNEQTLNLSLNTDEDFNLAGRPSLGGSATAVTSQQSPH